MFMAIIRAAGFSIICAPSSRSTRIQTSRAIPGSRPKPNYVDECGDFLWDAVSQWRAMRIFREQRCMAVCLFLSFRVCFAEAIPKTVHFQSEDRKTNLVGYVFEPSTAGRHAAIVLLHGRAGCYSSAAHGVHTSGTLSKRHKQWGDFWADRGYLAILVDSFSPRGYPKGFPRGSYEDRPAAVSEQTV